jgi:hypothetical protein
MAYTVFGAVSRKPAAFDFVKPWMFQYAQIRYMYDRGQLWDSYLATHTAPFAGSHGRPANNGLVALGA